MRPFFPTPVRLPCPGNLGERGVAIRPKPCNRQGEESGGALPLFQRNHPAQVFLRGKAGQNSERALSS